MQILERVKKDKYNRYKYRCICHCGKEFLCTKKNFKTKKSCGCHWRNNNVGTKYNDITILKEFSEKDKNNRSIKYYECLCYCGNKFIVRKESIIQNRTQSCGCLRKNLMREKKIENKDIGEKINNIEVIKRINKQTLNRKYYFELKCFCGNAFEAILSDIRSGKQKSCGCLNHNPSLTEEDRIKRRSILGIQIWKQGVFKRDDWTCQICNKRGGKLVAHHLNGYHWAKEERVDINNGITLCKEHHDEFHKVYGKKFNTKEQFQEYKENKLCKKL